VRLIAHSWQTRAAAPHCDDIVAAAPQSVVLEPLLQLALDVPADALPDGLQPSKAPG